MQPNKTHLPSLLTLIILVLGALFLLALAGILFTASLVSAFSGNNGTGEMIAAFAFGCESLLLLACAWFVLQKARQQETAEQSFQFIFAGRQVITGLAVVIIGAIIGGVTIAAGGAGLGMLIMPFLTVLVITTPLLVLFGISASGIEAGPRWRFFAILGLSLTIAPLSMVMLEVLALIVILIIGGVFITTTRPDLLMELASALQRVGEQPEDIALALESLAPYLTHPAVIVTVFGFVAVLVPLIEELLKPLAVWLFAAKLESTAQGFLLGALSGAAFALFESLNASTDASNAWAVIVGGRIGTAILHITASGLVGLGIAYGFKEKRLGLLFACYGAAVLAHSLWNASAIGLAFTGIGQLAGKTEWLALAPILLCGMLSLGGALLVILVALNRKFRNAAAPAESEMIIEIQPEQNQPENNRE